MAEVQFGVVLRHVRKLAGAPAAGSADGALLERFVGRRDEAAFETILARHGPLVYGVCRRLLGHEADAADAFQATFLVLVRRAGAVRRADSLGPWLYGVATRVALKMRRAAARRQTHEGRAAMTARTDRETEPADDLRPVLDEELGRLPEKYRAALVACYLEGHTQAQAAARLGWPPGSVAKRLARGLELLRGRLTRRGLALPAAGLAALLGREASAVPPTLARATLRAAVLAAAGKALTGAVSAPVVFAVEEIMRDFLVSRCKLLVPLVVGFFALGAGFAALRGAPPAPPETPAAEQPAPRPKPKLDADGEPLPDGALARLGTLRLRHGSPVTSVAWSPDGKLLATGSWDNYARLWDPADGRLVRNILSPDGWVWGVAFSPDGKLLATAGDQRGKKVRLWDVATGKLVRSFEGHANQIRGLAYAPDGKTIASASFDGSVRLWEAETGKELRQIAVGPQATLYSVAFSPDGKQLGTTDGGNAVRLWEAETGRATGTLDAAGGASLRSAAYSKDGKQMIAGAEDGNVWIWDVASAKELHQVRGRAMPAVSVAFSPDGKTFAVGYGDWQDGRRDKFTGEINLWDAATAKELRRVGRGTSPVQAIAFSPDGKALAAVTLNSSVLLWDPATGKQLLGANVHQAGVKAAAFAGSGTLITAGYDHTVRAWELASYEQRRVLVGRDVAAGVVALSADGKRLAWGGLDGKVHLGDAADGKEGRVLEGHTGPVWSVAFSPDGKRLASGGQDKTIRLWDAASGKELHTLEGHGNWVIALAFAPSGRLLASGSVDKSVRLWDPDAGKELRKFDGHTQEVSTVAFSPDGRTLASAARDDTVRLWELSTGRLRWQFGPNTMGRAAAAFSPDGRLLLTATSDKDRGIRLWDLASGKELCKVWGHRGFVQALAFAPDGKTAVSASDDSTVLVWDVAALRGAPAAPAAVAPAELETLWTDLQGEDAARAFLARGRLSAAPDQALPLLNDVLRPVASPEPALLARLLKELDDDDFTTRERATADLRRLAGAAEPELRKALEAATTAEVRERLKTVLEGEARGPSPDRLRQERALEVLEGMGTPGAKKLLQELAKGAPQAWLTREAKAALDRQARR